MTLLPVENLELRATEQRHHLHERATELKSKIDETREHLSITKQSRENFGPAALIVSAVGLLAGYTLTGMFTSR
jgi:hypothetical protein